jgi:hypothetical protein
MRSGELRRESAALLGEQTSQTQRFGALRWHPAAAAVRDALGCLVGGGGVLRRARSWPGGAAPLSRAWAGAPGHGEVTRRALLPRRRRSRARGRGNGHGRPAATCCSLRRRGAPPREACRPSSVLLAPISLAPHRQHDVPSHRVCHARCV